MTTEDYVGFETAKLLKERGFNDKGRYGYNSEGIVCEPVVSWKEISPFYPRPTLQMACKWLRDMHNIDICAFPEHYDYILWGYTCKIYKNKEQFCCLENFKLFEEAVETAIKYCLENLI